MDSEIKVAQFSGYVSEHSAYHHGEASLNGAIVNMAQDYMGSNNLNLLMPNGQFGTRLEGGKDSASERYIFTQLSKYTRMIFPPEDDAILEYVLDDGMKVEPTKYIPILPMVLVNGCCGIGTGTSTNVLCYNPIQLIDYLLERHKGTSSRPDFIPYYRGFKGRIEMDHGKCMVHGTYTMKDLTVRIQELPVGTWTVEYKAFLEESLGTIIKDYTDNSTDTDVDITVKLLNPIEDIAKTLKLTRTFGTNNMNLFDAEERLCKYASVHDIIDAFYTVRYDAYRKRKVYQEEVLARTLHKLTHKVKYIEAILTDKLDLRKKTHDEIVKALVQLQIEEHDGYSYLIKMPMDSVSAENVKDLKAEHARVQKELNDLKSTSIETMWSRELLRLRKCIESC